MRTRPAARLAALTTVLLSGCFGVSSTGTSGIVGVLLDSEGQPIPRVRVSSEEQNANTDEQGRFVVSWKSPATFVRFKRGTILWKRKWLPRTDEGEVTIQLPKTEDGEIACRTDVPCNAQLTWQVSEGLAGNFEVPCGQDTPVARVSEMPLTLPEVTCSTVMGETPMQMAFDGGRLVLRGQPQPREVDLAPAIEVATKAAREAATAAGKDPDAVTVTCQAHIGDGEVVQGVGQQGLQAFSDTLAWATCACEDAEACPDFEGGRAGPPVPVGPRPAGLTDEAAQVALSWAPRGADLVLDPPVGDPATLRLIRLDPDGGVGWEMPVEPARPGTYLLPELPRGRYLVHMGSDLARSSINPPTPEVPGTVVLLRHEGEWGEEGGYFGALELQEDTVGPLEVVGHGGE